MDVWLLASTVIVGGALCAYLFFTRNFNHFKNLGIPYVEPIPIFGNIAELIFKMKTGPDIMQATYKCHGDAKYVGFFDCNTPIIVLRDPELVKSITIKNFESFPNHRMFINSPNEPLFEKNLFALPDEEWRDMRTLLSPAFTSSKMKTMFKIVSKCAVQFSDNLSKLDPRLEELDMKDTFGRYTLDVIASAGFGLTVDSMKDRDNDFYLMGRESADYTGSKMLKFFIFRSFPWLAKLLGLKFLKNRTAEYFTNVIKHTVATRDAEGIVRPDMIQLMMQARDRREMSALTPEDMAAQAFIFLLGGFDTTSSTMCFAAHHIALDQNVQKKLQAEIDNVLGKGSGLSYEDLHAMEYLDAVVSETLRMYPPVPIMDRIGSKSFTLPPALPGLKPLQIGPRQAVCIPCYSFHHDPKYFADPGTFDPERFTIENKSRIDPSVYFPFGIGPRICVANRFALMEVKLALFHVLAKCDLVPTPKTQYPIRLSTKSMVIMPENGFWLKVRPRDSSL